MQWVKSHLVLVISGAVGVVSLVMIGLAIFLSDVQETLAANQSVYSSLQAAANKPVNSEVLDAVRRQQLDNRRRVEAFLGQAKTSVHATLRTGVFPVLKEEVNRIEFPRDHQRQREALLGLLKAGSPPDEQDVQDYQEGLDRTRKQEAIARGEDPNAVGTGAGVETITADMTPEERIKVDALAGAAVQRANQIRCYADLNSLDPASVITAPHPSDVALWKAQLSLWIQEDMVNILARVNEAEAVKVKAAGQEPNVTNLPVKHLLYLAVGNYVPADAGAGAAFSSSGGGAIAAAVDTADQGGPPPGLADAVFTARGSTPTVDVVHFAMGLVVDVRALPGLLDEIGKSGFFTPLSVSYEAVPYDPTLHENVYGPAPVIRVRLEYEACMLREKYQEWMPEAVKAGGLSGPSGSGGGVGGGVMGGPQRPGQPYGPPAGVMER